MTGSEIGKPRRFTRRHLVGTAVITALCASVAFGAGFAVADTDDTYYACVDSKNRVIADKITQNKPPTCGGGQRVVSWGSTGEPGPPGPPGEEGPPGPPGADGAATSIDDLEGSVCFEGTPYEGTLEFVRDGENVDLVCDRELTLTLRTNYSFVGDVQGGGDYTLAVGTVALGSQDVCGTYTPDHGAHDAYNDGDGNGMVCPLEVPRDTTIVLTATPTWTGFCTGFPGAEFACDFPRGDSEVTGWTGCDSNPTPEVCEVNTGKSDREVTVTFGPPTPL